MSSTSGKGRSSRRRTAAVSNRFDNLDKALRLLRERRGLSQAELAAALGIAASTVSSWERGARKPSLAILAGVADRLGLDLGDLDQALDLVNGRHRPAPQREPDAPLDLRRMARQLAGGGALATEDEETIHRLLEALERTFGQGGSERAARRPA